MPRANLGYVGLVVAHVIVVHTHYGFCHHNSVCSNRAKEKFHIIRIFNTSWIDVHVDDGHYIAPYIID